jgi:hypothetical protein
MHWAQTGLSVVNAYLDGVGAFAGSPPAKPEGEQGGNKPSLHLLRPACTGEVSRDGRDLGAVRRRDGLPIGAEDAPDDRVLMGLAHFLEGARHPHREHDAHPVRKLRHVQNVDSGTDDRAGGAVRLNVAAGDSPRNVHRSDASEVSHSAMAPTGARQARKQPGASGCGNRVAAEPWNGERMRFSYFYVLAKEEPERVRVVATEHARYWRGLDLPNYLGGPLGDGSSGHITFEADDVDEAQRLLIDDPLMRGELIERAWLNEWHVE